jgi:predicted DCC family thiol-disulfide oxidoreductase YuxK
MAELEVYYDGGCPVCAREIAHYRGRPGAERIVWVDVAGTLDASLGPDLTRGAALARLHVRREDGTLVDGAAAFAEIWARLPGFRWLAHMMRLWPVPWVAEALYSGFLRMRRLWRDPTRERGA